MVRKPKHTYMFAHTLLGRSIDSPQAKLFKEFNYPYELVPVKERYQFSPRYRQRPVLVFVPCEPSIPSAVHLNMTLYKIIVIQ
jgi:hypothetical protein